ncbi:MAG TPA: hypothetical protein VIT67_02040, partial [Povalibacter sp.]
MPVLHAVRSDYVIVHDRQHRVREAMDSEDGYSSARTLIQAAAATQHDETICLATIMWLILQRLIVVVVVIHFSPAMADGLTEPPWLFPLDPAVSK